MENIDPTNVGLNYPNSRLVTNSTQPQKARLDVDKPEYPKTKDVYTMAQEKKINSSKYLTSVREKLEEISELLNFEMKVRSTNLDFQVDEPTNRVVVKVINRDTGNVIREVPSEAILRVSKNIEALKGILFDGRY
jgi:flagellar protein FlaG